MSDSKANQQLQTLDYFRRVADEWRLKAEGGIPAAVNVIQLRSACVLEAATKSRPRRALDVGCGTGELVCELAGLGIDAVGVDFSPEMIALAQQKAAAMGLDRASFLVRSIFDFDDRERFDLISAQGFIEYISHDELTRFLSLAGRLLNDGGSIVIGSRNRLFNLFSLNEYTDLEREMGSVDRLLEENLLLTRAATLAEFAEAAQSLRELPSVSQHPRTGIDVAVRHQYTPAELIRLLNAAGFRTENLWPVHYHGMPPARARQLPALHRAIASRVHESCFHDHAMVPWASSFVVHARRT